MCETLKVINHKVIFSYQIISPISHMLSACFPVDALKSTHHNQRKHLRSVNRYTHFHSVETDLLLGWIDSHLAKGFDV